MSIDPLDSNIIDLLNLALESNVDMDPLGLGSTGLKGKDKWESVMMERKMGLAPAAAHEPSDVGPDASFESNDAMEEESGMDLSVEYE